MFIDWFLGCLFGHWQFWLGVTYLWVGLVLQARQQRVVLKAMRSKEKKVANSVGQIVLHVCWLPCIIVETAHAAAGSLFLWCFENMLVLHGAL